MFVSLVIHVVTTFACLHFSFMQDAKPMLFMCEKAYTTDTSQFL